MKSMTALIPCQICGSWWRTSLTSEQFGELGLFLEGCPICNDENMNENLEEAEK